MKHGLVIWLEYSRSSFWIPAIFTGVLLGIGFIFSIFWFLGVIGIALCVKKIQSATSYIEALGFVATVFTVKALCALSWSWSAYPIEWINLSGSVVQITVIFLYWFSGALWLGAGGIIFALLARASYLTKIYPRFLWYITLSFLWILAEVAGAWFFSLMTMGPDSVLQSHLSFGFVGYLLGTTVVGIWLAKFAAVYGLTIMMVYLGIGCLFIVRVRNRAAFFRVALVSIVVVVISTLVVSRYDVYKIQASPAQIVTINTTFSPLFLSTELGQQKKSELIKKAVEAAVALAPDFILLPEDSRYLQSINPEQNPYQAMAYFQFTHQGTNSILIDSGRFELPSGETVLRATVFDGRSKSIYQSDKQYLVPQGEYVPTLYRVFMTGLGYGDRIEAIANDTSYQPGPLTSLEGAPDYLPGILFCSESVRPDGVRAIMQQQPVLFIAHPISHGWFHTPSILWQQLDVMLQIQSRYNNVPIVSSGNMVTGKLYLPDGTIKAGKVVGTGERFELVQFEF